MRDIFEYSRKRCSWTMKTNDTDKRLKLQERLLTIKKRNIIRWNIYRENNFHSRREVSKCSLKIRCATNADCRLADLQTCRPADLQTRRFADPHFLWQGFALFTVGESQSMSEANSSASGLQARQCPIRQVTGNPCGGRLNIGRTVT